MKKLLITIALLATTAGVNAQTAPGTAAADSQNTVHRYLIERTFPIGALAGLDAATKAKVNATNASVGVRWVESFANADKTKTYCVYEGPSESAIREAARLNNLPVDNVVEVPVTLTPQ